MPKKTQAEHTVISLAKKQEEVFFPDRAEPLKLQADSKALHVLQNVRMKRTDSQSGTIA